MKTIDSALQCPSCHGPLTPKVLGCDECQLKVEGPFQLNEFATLAPEDLHFLRIFIRCEGRIRDMEPALGLSYPTIRNRLTQLKGKLSGETDDGTPTRATRDDEGAQATLAMLEAGKITFDEALARIKKSRSEKG